ncbi:MAG: hypothetical protein WB508_04690 [Aeromicrobium sp.]|uniref:hypothetical protein n=1 Tax=Aeromicrobium sp. TaxID=1871063 RepID=UPI003C680657
MSGDDEGQVSEVQKMDPADADTPISDSQAVDGQPDGPSDDVQEGARGPNAKTGRVGRGEDSKR